MGTSRASKNLLLKASKAKKMLKEGKAMGKKLTQKQRGYFGVIASGKKTKKA